MGRGRERGPGFQRERAGNGSVPMGVYALVNSPRTTFPPGHPPVSR